MNRVVAMMRDVKVVAVVAAILSPTPARGQVGYDPGASPYRDLSARQGLTVYSGQFNAGRDPAGVAVKSGPLAGVRYDLRLGGPAELTVRAARVFSTRTLLDASKPRTSRQTGTTDGRLWLTDIGLSINLTGQKSFHNFVPVIHAGLGAASDFSSKPDASGYKFGTTFALAYGAGVRWVPGGRFQIRADMGDHMFQLAYPDSYYVPATDGTSILGRSQPQSAWKHNLALTLGATYLFFR
ncbi:MAG: hypothetical protein NVS1B4_25770 [Gemmatimonadaceae bacterium]